MAASDGLPKLTWTCQVAVLWKVPATRSGDAELEASMGPGPDVSGARFHTFGELLRFLRRRAGLRQRELAARVGYSEAHISRLEGGQRRADPVALAALFIPALRLERQPDLAARLLALAERAQPSRRAPAPGYGVPLPAPHLVPRPEVVAALTTLMNTQRVVVVCGLPGAGKTTLVAATARDWATTRGPVCWLAASAGTQPPVLARRLAATLREAGGPEAGGPAIDTLPLDRQLDVLMPELAATPILLCVDDGQALGDAAATLALISDLSARGGLRVLVASRERLPLGDSAHLRLGGLSVDQARALVDRLDPEMPADLIERLARRTGGNPMLLRLVLGQARQPGGDRIRLVDGLESDPEVTDRLIDAALRGLSEPALNLVALLAVFRTPVNLHDEHLATHVHGWWPDLDLPAAVAELQRRQLLDHPTSATLHPLIRDHLVLRSANDPSARRRRHAIAAALGEADEDPLEAAWHLSRSGDPARAAEVLTTHVRMLIGRGQNLAAADVAEGLLRQIRLEGPADPELVRRLHLVRGDLLVNTERGDEAQTAYRHALEQPMPAAVRALVVLRLAESLLERNQPAEALALCADALAGIGPREALLSARLDALQAWAQIQLSEYRDALPLARRALKAAEPLTTVTPQLAGEVIARAEWTLGVALRLESRGDAATHLRRAAWAARSAGLHHLEARALFNVAALRWDEGDMAGALADFRTAEASARASADSAGVARALSSIGTTYVYLGEVIEAVARFHDAMALRARLGDTQGALTTRVGLANALMHLGRVAEALAILDEATQERRAEPRTLVYALDSRALALLLAGRVEDAIRAARRAVALARRHVPAMAALLEAHLALGHLILGNPDPAREAARREVNAYTFEDETDTMFLRAALAFVDRDRTALTSVTGELSEWVEAHGLRLHDRTAPRLLDAYDRQVPLIELPRLMWSPADPGLAGPAPGPGSDSVTS
jgi:tetratricopeptide (TPR) repeat protein